MDIEDKVDWEIIGLWVGIGVTFLLGLFNLFLGGGILRRREKVIVRNSEVCAEFLRKGTREMFYGHITRNIITLACDVISIDASCDLVLTGGEQELEVKEVEVILDKKARKSLERYFRIRNSIELQQVDYYEGKPLSPPILLVPRKTARFRNKVPFDCTNEFEKEYEKMESGSYPEFVQPLLDKLETKYQICWTRYDYRRLCWRFPQKWWRNPGKRVWG